MILLRAMSYRRCRTASVLAVTALLSACADTPITSIDLMPAPDVYGDGLLNPLPEQNPLERIPYKGILYATDRAPATANDKETYYVNDRGRVLRVGVAELGVGDNEIDWEAAREISLLKSRSDRYPVKIRSATEWGILESTVPFWVDLSMVPDEINTNDATDRFVEAINAQLALSKNKDVYIYTHGYRVVFENPLLVSTELWHFLGYDGVFIAYAWPSTPSRWAYIKDSDTSDGFARNFRLLVETIAKSTDVEQIHIMGYSNGTRLVTRAMEQLALIRQEHTREENYEELKVGNLFLLGSDLDEGVFGSYVADGLLDVTKHVTVYLSEHDKALRFSQMVSKRQRLGQLWGGGADGINPQARQAIERFRDQITYINVSSAEGANTGNGHGYFRSSPWVSSDLLMTLRYGLSPRERGLIEQEDLPVFTFPPDYIARLWSAIEEADPVFADAYRQLKASQAADDTP
jgi:esterase/lipase superfamily enzyme